MFSQPRTFRCPNCNEMIIDTMTECRYCAVPLDPGVVELVAERQEKANQACSDASYLKTVAIAMWVFLGLSCIPIVPLVGWGFLFTFVAVIVLFVRWQVKFGGLLTSDSDFVVAKRRKNLALILWLVAAPVGFMVRPLLALLFQRLV